MEIDTDRIDDAILALLHPTLDRDGRAWKGFDFNAMDRLQAKGFICDPVGRAKSVLLTHESEVRSKALFEAMFSKPT